MTASLKCMEYLELHIGKHRLGREETQALVQAMESSVALMVLEEEVTLDIEVLTEYSGQGQCNDILLHNDTEERYREELLTWAKIKNWRYIKRDVWHTGSALRLERLDWIPL